MNPTYLVPTYIISLQPGCHIRNQPPSSLSSPLHSYKPPGLPAPTPSQRLQLVASPEPSRHSKTDHIFSLFVRPRSLTSASSLINCPPFLVSGTGNEARPVRPWRIRAGLPISPPSRPRSCDPRRLPPHLRPPGPIQASPTKPTPKMMTRANLRPCLGAIPPATSPARAFIPAAESPPISPFANAPSLLLRSPRR